MEGGVLFVSGFRGWPWAGRFNWMKRQKKEEHMFLPETHVARSEDLKMTEERALEVWDMRWVKTRTAPDLLTLSSWCEIGNELG